MLNIYSKESTNLRRDFMEQKGFVASCSQKEVKGISRIRNTDRTMTEKNRKIPEPLYCAYFCHLLFLSHHLIVKPNRELAAFCRTARKWTVSGGSRT